MAAVTWVCPVGDCDVRQDRPGTCPQDLVQLVREQTEPETLAEPGPETPAAGPDADPAVRTGLALDCPWGQVIDIPADELEIGRSATAFRGSDIDRYDQVSRVHARLFWRDGRLHVEDLGSANGTFVDGEEVTDGRAEPVGPGQELRLGLDVPCQIVQLNEFGEPV